MAELERRQKISAAFKGKSRGPGKAWSAEARKRHSNVVRLRWETTTEERRAEIADKISTARSLRVDEGHKRCSGRCGRVLPNEEFGSDPRNKDGLFGSCKSCQSEKSLQWATDHPEQVRNFRRAHYNIDFNQLWGQQQGLCALCGEPMLPRGKSAKSVVIDHDHNCCPPTPGRSGSSCGKCVRGLLHSACNRFLGLLEKNPEKVDQGRDYLRRWQEKVI